MKKFRLIIALFLALMAITNCGFYAFADQAESIPESIPEHTSALEIEAFEYTEDIDNSRALSELENAYIKYTTFCDLYLIDDIPSYEGFVTNYINSDFSTVDSFLSYSLEAICPTAFQISSDVNNNTRAGGGDWYFNTGTTLPQHANYNTYNLLSQVKKGDIIYETTGNFAPIAGHISIVEGVFWSTTQNQFYIRVVEASAPTVCRGVFDEDRLANKSGVILRVTGATEWQKQQAVSFCINHIGNSYLLHTPKHSSANYTEWYCSELVWAAYYNSGIDLLNDPSDATVLPADIYASNKTSIVYYSTVKPASRFTDTSGCWVKASIDFLVNGGMMTGQYSTVFSPNTYMTRGDLVQLLYKLAGTPATSQGGTMFSDVSSRHALYHAVKWASANGIVSGYSDGSFRPLESLTRQQFVAFLYRYANYCGVVTSYNTNALVGFTDANLLSSYAVTPMKWAITHGIINGTTATTLSPTDPCTRAQCAVITTSFLNICL